MLRAPEPPGAALPTQLPLLDLCHQGKSEAEAEEDWWGGLGEKAGEGWQRRPFPIPLWGDFGCNSLGTHQT